MLPEGVEVKPMQTDDIDSVVEIIESHDEDDAEAARESYEELGVDNQFVLTEHGKLIGVTGYREANGADNTYWLSWTYLLPEKQGQKYGTSIVNSLLDHLKSNDARKIFVSTSDYRDEESGKDLYAAAKALYDSIGFKEEVRHRHYYEPDETQFIYGLRLADSVPEPIAADQTSVEIEGVYEIDETDDAYYIEWKPKSFSLFGAKTQVSKEDFDEVIDYAREEEARAVFASFPSNMDSVLQPLIMAGFFEEGRLRDYYKDGVDEIHFRYNI